MYEKKNKVEFVTHLYSRTAGLLLIYSLLIKNERRFISSTVLFRQLTDYSKWRITQCCAEAIVNSKIAS